MKISFNKKDFICEKKQSIKQNLTADYININNKYFR